MWRLGVVVCVLAIPSASARNPKLDSAPGYNGARVFDISGVVEDVREVTNGLPHAGLHVLVRTDRKECLDVFVGPLRFIQELGVSFGSGEAIHITGSRVMFDGTDLLLAREIGGRGISVYLRDAAGKPFWTE